MGPSLDSGADVEAPGAGTFDLGGDDDRDDHGGAVEDVGDPRGDAEEHEPADRGLNRLADELLCKRTDVLRLAMGALRQNRDLRLQIRADNAARAFLQALRDEYGPNAELRPSGRRGETPTWSLGGQPIDGDDLAVSLREQGGGFVIDLFQPKTNVAIHNAFAWDTEEELFLRGVTLADLWVHSPYATIGEPKASRTIGGHTVVDIEEDDGTVRQLVLDSKGIPRPLNTARDVPIAESAPDPSVGVGVRRESVNGPHLGRGVGGKWVLTGDLQEDRSAVIDALKSLIEKTRNGELDGILNLRADHEQPGARAPETDD